MKHPSRAPPKLAKAALASQREKIRHDPSAKPIAVPPDTKAAAKADYRATTHNIYVKLIPSITPHDRCNVRSRGAARSGTGKDKGWGNITSRPQSRWWG